MSDPQADDIDDATAELIIMLQQEDLDALEQQKKGKGRADQLSDADLAEQLYIEELQRAGIAFADRRMAQSMARALASDEAVLHEHQDQERAAGEDHEFARRLGGVGGTRVRQQIIAQKQARADSGPGPSLDRVSIALRNGQDNKEVTDGGDSEERSSSGKGAATNKPDDKPMTICGICREQALASEIIELACQHQYCKRCLQQLFVASMTDESMYPPRCCRQPIAFELVKPFLQAEEIELFERKKEEFETANRTYCSSPGCSAFISPKHIENGKAVCGICQTITCEFCKAKSHDGDCPQVPALREVLRVAKENGWKRCFSCRSIIELTVGCYHIRCRCGVEFCYNCGEPWKECTCPQWEEERLIARANQNGRLRGE